jgi:hypothetical protein
MYVATCAIDCGAYAFTGFQDDDFALVMLSKESRPAKTPPVRSRWTAANLSKSLRDRPMSDNLLNRGQPDRSKTNMSEDYEVQYWNKDFGISRGELQKAVDKVGNSAVAVRKQLSGKPPNHWRPLRPTLAIRVRSKRGGHPTALRQNLALRGFAFLGGVRLLER